MVSLPTKDSFVAHLDAVNGLLEPHGEFAQAQNRTHSFAVLAGAYVNSFHAGIARVLAKRTIAGVDPLKRTEQTMEILDEVEFGETATAVSAAERLWRLHAHATATMDDGTPVAATDTDLLAVALMTGFRTTAALRVLTHPARTKSIAAHVQDHFEAYWPERAGMMAAVGIPQGYLPDDPIAAQQWWADQIQHNLIANAEQQSLETILDQFTSKASDELSDKGKRLLDKHLVSGVVTREVVTIAYYSAPEFLQPIAFPQGPPQFGRTELLTLPAANRMAPEWLSGGIPRECPQANRVMTHLAEEE
ncbi:MAG: DUF2236 domain-containing protein [Actinomycetia bacterium]|nr:DUF2236 domain-containing protein [Actinomycetes bacterium]